MARQLRLVLPGLPHLISQQALPGLALFTSAAERDRFLVILRDAAAAAQVQVHAYALLPGEVRMLATPGDGGALSRCIQALGRRYVSAYNRAHRRSGTIWAGRFRCAAMEPGAWTLLALRYVDGAAPEPMGTTSAHHRCGGPRDGFLADPPPYWGLGNTPFERESAFARLLHEPLAAREGEQIERCLRGGWPCGTEGFVRTLGTAAGRPTAPRPRGRPSARSPSLAQDAGT